jgi:hypothetical protein
MTENRKAMTLASIIVAALVVVAGCSSSGGGKPTSSAPISRSSSITSTSQPPSDPNTTAIDEAVAIIPSYLATLDKLYNDPTTQLNEIYKVAIQPESTVEAVAIGKFRAGGYRGSGQTKLVSTRAATAYLTGLGGTGPTAKEPTVKVNACVDVSASKATDAQGRAIGDSKKPKYLIEKLTIVKATFSGSSAWRVSDAPNTEATSCGV